MLLCGASAAWVQSHAMVMVSVARSASPVLGAVSLSWAAKFGLIPPKSEPLHLFACLHRRTWRFSPRCWPTPSPRRCSAYVLRVETAKYCQHLSEKGFPFFPQITAPRSAVGHCGHGPDAGRQGRCGLRHPPGPGPAGCRARQQVWSARWRWWWELALTAILSGVWTDQRQKSCDNGSTKRLSR